MDLLDMLDMAPKPRKATLPPPEPWTKGPDPWDTPEGRKAAARWGMEDKPKREAKSDPSDDVDPWATPFPATRPPSAPRTAGTPRGPWSRRPRPSRRRRLRRDAWCAARRRPKRALGGPAIGAGMSGSWLTIMAAEAYAIGPDDPDATLLALPRRMGSQPCRMREHARRGRTGRGASRRGVLLAPLARLAARTRRRRGHRTAHARGRNPRRPQGTGRTCRRARPHRRKGPHPVEDAWGPHRHKDKPRPATDGDRFTRKETQEQWQTATSSTPNPRHRRSGIAVGRRP